VLVHRSGLVEVEVAEPEPGEGEDEAALELQDGGVEPVRLGPGREPQDAPGDDEVDNPDDVAEIEERDLTSGSSGT
jgi:hypothetical protein